MPSPNQRRSSGKEDWTQITDSRLRKRIQNRLSQRKHREKIRRGSTNEEATSNSLTGGEASPLATDTARARSSSVEVSSTRQAQATAIETVEDNSKTTPDVSPLTFEPSLDHTKGWNGNLMDTLLDYSGSNVEVNLESEVQASSSTSTWPRISQFPDLSTPPVSEINNLSAGTDLTTSVTNAPSIDDFVPLASAHSAVNSCSDGVLCNCHMARVDYTNLVRQVNEGLQAIKTLREHCTTQAMPHNRPLCNANNMSSNNCTENCQLAQPSTCHHVQPHHHNCCAPKFPTRCECRQPVPILCPRCRFEFPYIPVFRLNVWDPK